MTTRILTVALAVLCCAGAVRAEEKNALNDEQAKKAAKLIADLGADEFETRNKAEKELATLGAGVVPLLKDTIATTKDMEVKTRAERALKVLALEAENDPVVLAKLARDEALAKHYAEAAPFYAKAAKLFQLQSNDSSDTATVKDLAERAKKAAEREKRALLLAKPGASDGEHVQVIQNGGAVVRIMSVTSGQAVDSKDDW